MNPTVNGPAEVTRWRCIAEERDGEPIADSIGKVSYEVSRHFSVKTDAAAYGRFLITMGFRDVTDPIPLACSYHGPTDSPSNAWSVHGTIDADQATHLGEDAVELERTLAEAHAAYVDRPPVFACDPDESAGYATDDPKHSDWHSRHASLWDTRSEK